MLFRYVTRKFRFSGYILRDSEKPECRKSGVRGRRGHLLAVAYSSSPTLGTRNTGKGWKTTGMAGNLLVKCLILKVKNDSAIDNPQSGKQLKEIRADASNTGLPVQRGVFAK